MDNMIVLRTKEEFRAIDIAKMACALLVVSIHVFLFIPGESVFLSYVDFLERHCLARIAVPFFFVCSSFFLFRKIDFENMDTSVVKKYLKRIGVAYLFWTVVYLPLQVHFIAGFQKSFFLSFMFYCRAFLFDGSYYHLWYLPSLFFAVFLGAIFVYYKVDTRIILALSTVLYIIGLLGDSWYGFFKPIEEAVPVIGDLATLYRTFFITTRNGLFDGFIFVSIGIFAAKNDMKFSTKKMGLLFVIFVVLMTLESVLLEKNHISIDYNMKLFLVPAVFTMFYFVAGIRITTDKKIYERLRLCSSVTFFTHLLFYSVLQCTPIADYTHQGISLMYVCTIICCVLFTFVVEWLRQYKAFRWMKKVF